MPDLSAPAWGSGSAYLRRIAYGANKNKELRYEVRKLFSGHWIDFTWVSCWGVGSVLGAVSWERKQARPDPLPEAYDVRNKTGEGRGQARKDNKGSADVNGGITT